MQFVADLTSFIRAVVRVPSTFRELETWYERCVPAEGDLVTVKSHEDTVVTKGHGAFVIPGTWLLPSNEIFLVTQGRTKRSLWYTTDRVGVALLLSLQKVRGIEGGAVIARVDFMSVTSADAKIFSLDLFYPEDRFDKVGGS